MIYWLDWKYFGNGKGMGSPYFDDVFYWLKDMSKGNRETAKGRFYLCHPGFGAQLVSFEWFKPEAGTTRHLAGMDFRVFNAIRRWLRVDVSWGRVPVVSGIDDLNSVVNSIQKWGHGI